MRKLIATAAFVAVMLPGTAAADLQGLGGGRVRFDGNDTASLLDIEQVYTERNRRNTFFGVQTYDQFFAADVSAQQGSWFEFRLDTKRRGATDRYLYLYYWDPDAAFYCELQTRSGRVLALRFASYDGISLFCGVRTGLLDIQKVPKFGVESRDRGVYVDRAPNFGRYRRL